MHGVAVIWETIYEHVAATKQEDSFVVVLIAQLHDVTTAATVTMELYF